LLLLRNAASHLTALKLLLELSFNLAFVKLTKRHGLSTAPNKEERDLVSCFTQSQTQ
jgi:hypothetical protein